MKYISIVLVIAAMSICKVASSEPVNAKKSEQQNETVIEVTGYYKAASGDTTKWNPISLKVKMNKSVNGETYEVVAYKFPLDYGWMDLYYGCYASKVQGVLSETYALTTSVGGYTAYFNLC